MLRLTACLLIFPAIAAAGPLTELPSHGEIPRFYLLTEGLYRGGQPTTKGFELLKDRGIKTVINLRMENDEAGIVQKLGMNYVQIPIEDIRPWTAIPGAAIAKYFELINNPNNYPIFFHCRRGADRTGAMAALYRIGIQRWDPKKAYSEARDIGMRWMYQSLKDQIYAFRTPARPTDLEPEIKKR